MPLRRFSEKTRGRLVTVWIVGFTLTTLWLVMGGREAHDALCAFRADLERRADDGQAYLDDVRAGKREPIPGFTLTDIQRSIDGQRATLRSLGDLDC